VEAATLSTLGAVIGLAAVLVIEATTPLPAAVAPWSLAASAVTGVIFGMLSAMRAAKLDPVAALRHE
jgi:putative ABC transport system permease protein